MLFMTENMPQPAPKAIGDFPCLNDACPLLVVSESNGVDRHRPAETEKCWVAQDNQDNLSLALRLQEPTKQIRSD